MNATSEIADLSYEQARDELIQVVNKLETGGVSLEESLALWERGEALATHCESWLLGAKAKLEKARAQTLESKNTAASEGES